MKQTVVFDFDGVIHSYTSGWRGMSVIPDPPVPGIKDAIAEIRAAGYEVVVVSTRCASQDGYGAVRAWLVDNEIEVDAVYTKKPPAICYIDDCALCFDGNPATLLGKIQTFEPWYKKKGQQNTVTQEQIDALMANAKIETMTIFGKCTVMFVQLENGFTLTESSACVDPANYNPEIGAEICKAKIEARLWELEGYALQKKLHEEG